MTIVKLKAWLCGEGISDIVVAGYVDEERGDKRFVADYRTIFLELDDGFLRLSAVDTTGTLRIAQVAQVGCEVELEDDMSPASASLREQILWDANGRQELVSLSLFGLECEEQGARCHALQIELGNGQVLFFDPSYHFGIRIGSLEQKEIWRENWPDAANIIETNLMLRSRLV